MTLRVNQLAGFGAKRQAARFQKIASASGNGTGSPWSIDLSAYEEDARRRLLLIGGWHRDNNNQSGIGSLVVSKGGASAVSFTTHEERGSGTGGNNSIRCIAASVLAPTNDYNRISFSTSNIDYSLALFMLTGFVNSAPTFSSGDFNSSVDSSSFGPITIDVTENDLVMAFIHMYAAASATWTRGTKMYDIHNGDGASISIVADDGVAAETGASFGATSSGSAAARAMMLFTWR